MWLCALPRCPCHLTARPTPRQTRLAALPRSARCAGDEGAQLLWRLRNGQGPRGLSVRVCMVMIGELHPPCVCPCSCPTSLLSQPLTLLHARLPPAPAPQVLMMLHSRLKGGGRCAQVCRSTLTRGSAARCADASHASHAGAAPRSRLHSSRICNLPQAAPRMPC